MGNRNRRSHSKHNDREIKKERKLKKEKKVRNPELDEEIKKSKKVKGKKKKKHIILRLFKWLIILFILLAIVGAAIFFGIFFSDKWDISMDDLTLSNINTTIYDRDGNEIGSVSGEEKRKFIPLSEMPENLKNAYIAIEDKTFYSHYGINLKRTIGATIKYVLNRGNSAAFGGSTITQQLVKNLKKDKDNSGVAGVQRKIREMSRAYKVEKMLSKDQILELYLNIIFVGGDAYGVQLGSQYYFSKNVGDLSLAECAFLAGVNDAPNSYNPFGENNHADIIKKRTKTVLAEMKDQKMITEEEYNAAVAEVEEGLKFNKGSTSAANTMSYLAKAALNSVVKQYAEEKDLDKEYAEAKIYGGGYKIYTTQNSWVQSTMEEVYRSGDYMLWNRDGEHVQSAMVVIDHKTGQVVGCMGGFGDDVDSNGLNRAVQSLRQPGSAIKPLAAIAPGLESGIITASTVYDESSTSFGGFHPTNSNVGLITVRKAIEISANTTEVKIMRELGPSNSIEFMKKMGITTLDEEKDNGLTTVLGGVTYGISPLEMAAAYATIANNGVYITPIFFTKVEDGNGNVILEPKQEKNRVMSEENAFIEQSILTGPVSGSSGTATNCKISGMDTAGKTGTTTSNKDRWMCGFTPYYTAAVWYGFDEPQYMSSYNTARNIWAAVMRPIHEGLESARFEKPANVVSATVCKVSGKCAVDGCEDTYTEYFVRGTVPGHCDGHQTLNICKETGKIATEFCEDTEERTYTVKPEKERNGNWNTNDDGKYDVPTETCDVHTFRKVSMPNVVGLKQSEAEKKLKDLGLKVTVKNPDNITDGKVSSQDKKTGTELKTGDTVVITIKKESVSPSNNITNDTNTNTNTNTSNTTDNTNTDSSNTAKNEATNTQAVTN